MYTPRTLFYIQSDLEAAQEDAIKLRQETIDVDESRRKELTKVEEQMARERRGAQGKLQEEIESRDVHKVDYEVCLPRHF